MTRTLLATLAALACTAACAQPAIRAQCDGLSIEVAGTAEPSTQVELMGATATGGPVFRLDDGHTGEVLPPQPGTAWQFDGLRATLTLTERESCIEWLIVIDSAGPEQRWLTLTVALPLPLEEPWAGWDGSSETAAVSAPAYSNGIDQVFPMCCAWDGERGLALGLQPQSMISDMSLGSDPGAESPLFAAVKLVIDPGETESVGFVAYAFEPRFGWRDALERYYRLYPEWFSPAEGTDPQLWGTGGYLRSGGSRLAWEEARRFRFGWDWGYAPYRITGDWYAHAEHYDGAYGDLDDWHEKMRHEDEVEGRVAVALNYIIPQFINVELAREHFPDALLRDQNGNLIASEGSWVKQDETITGGWYWGNSAMEHSLASLRELAEQRRVEGISFDNATGGGMRYGPGPANSPGRAFTPGQDGPVWAVEGISYAGHMDFVHTLSNGEHRLMVAANGPRCLLTAFRTDVAMHEAAPYYETGTLEAMRRLLGHKPLICWEDHPENELDWERMSPEELRLALERDYEFWVMYGLWTGVTPSAHRVRGNSIMLRHLDGILAVQRAGWWPAPAMRADADLWLGRFGEGTGAILTLGNATGADVAAQVEVLTDYLGPGCWGLAAFDGREGPSVANADGIARVTLPIANRRTTVLRVALQLEGVNALTATCTRFTPDGHAPATARWRLQAPQPASVTVRHCLPEGACVTAVRLNGAVAPSEQAGAEALARLDLPAGESVLEVDWVPRVVVEDREAIPDFPFLRDGQPACEIVAPDDVPEGVRFAAERIAVYFEYWTAAQVKPGATPSTLMNVEERALIPVVTAPQEADRTPQIVVSIGEVEGPASGRVAFSADPVSTLLVIGEDADALNAVVLALLDVLDERYPYAGTLSVGGPFYEKLGLGPSSVFE